MGQNDLFLLCSRDVERRTLINGGAASRQAVPHAIYIFLIAKHLELIHEICHDSPVPYEIPITENFRCEDETILSRGISIEDPRPPKIKVEVLIRIRASVHQSELHLGCVQSKCFDKGCVGPPSRMIGLHELFGNVSRATGGNALQILKSYH